IKQHIKYRIEQPSTQVILAGYQAPGTLGHHLHIGTPRIKLLGVERHVRAKVHMFDSYSGHADYSGLIQWIEPMKHQAKRVFITHGEFESAQSLSEKIQHHTTIIPDIFEKHQL